MPVLGKGGGGGGGGGRFNPAIAFVGEQPGHQEDLAGKPFVGPAGKLLDRAMEEAGIDRKQVYVTNAVKHFKFEPRGKRRMHSKPNAGEVKHYRWWLQKELRSGEAAPGGGAGCDGGAGAGRQAAADRQKPWAADPGWTARLHHHPSVVPAAHAAGRQSARRFVTSCQT